MTGQPIMRVADLVRRFGGRRSLFGAVQPSVHAVQGINLELRERETLGIVGESGCGKSTLARLMVGLDLPTQGGIRLRDADVTKMAVREPRVLARDVQYVFQDPLAALNPRKTIRQILETPMRCLRRLDAAQRQDRLGDIMAAVNLRPEFLDRYPHELSGGQAQRIGIARALAAEPRVVVLDEPVSALDVSVQAQVLNLLDELKSRFGLTYVFISHDLSVVESISDRVAVMYFGRVVEFGAAREVFAAPRHPYTRLLFDSAPVPGRRRVRADEGMAELPDPYNPPPGCAFAPRCKLARDICRQAVPVLDGEGRAACFFPLQREQDSAT